MFTGGVGVGEWAQFFFSLLACVPACVTHARSLNLDADPDVPVFFMSDQ